MEHNCKRCRQHFTYDKTISENGVSLYYDEQLKSRFAAVIKDSWVGISKEGKIYCRLCLKTKKVVFSFDLL